MTPSQFKLADRLAEYLQDKWRPGMLHAAVDADGELEDFQRVNDGDRVPEDRVPVLDDDCTKGALLGMVRDKTREAGAYVLPIRSTLANGRHGPIGGWEVLRIGTTGVAPTEGEALALALLEVL